MKVTYQIAVYSKVKPHRELERLQIYDIDFEELSMIFDPEGLDPELIHCHDLDEVTAVLINEYVKGEINLDKYDYQLVCEAID